MAASVWLVVWFAVGGNLHAQGATGTDAQARSAGAQTRAPQSAAVRPAKLPQTQSGRLVHSPAAQRTVVLPITLHVAESGGAPVVDEAFFTARIARASD